MINSNDPGGVPIFRGIDLPGAYREPQYQIVGATGKDLERWFSLARMSRYKDDPSDARYVWNSRVSKAILEDIGHVEVLLRNFIDTRLTADSGLRRWWESDKYPRLGSFRVNVKRATERLQRGGHEVNGDQIIASLSLDNWRFLLTSRLEATVWRALIHPSNGGMPHYPGHRRSRFEENVEVMRFVRNRASHQEPLIGAKETPHQEMARLCGYVSTIDWIARCIDPDAADWIGRQSRTVSVLAQRPDIAAKSDVDGCPRAE